MMTQTAFGFMRFLKTARKGNAVIFLEEETRAQRISTFSRLYRYKG
jgi:hypothetical protein